MPFSFQLFGQGPTGKLSWTKKSDAQDMAAKITEGLVFPSRSPLSRNGTTPILKIQQVTGRLDLSPCPPIITCFQVSTQKLQRLLVLAWWTFSWMWVFLLIWHTSTNHLQCTDILWESWYNVSLSIPAQPSLAACMVEFLQGSVLVGHPLGIKGRLRIWEETTKAANEVSVFHTQKEIRFHISFVHVCIRMYCIIILDLI